MANTAPAQVDLKSPVSSVSGGMVPTAGLRPELRKGLLPEGALRAPYHHFQLEGWVRKKKGSPIELFFKLAPYQDDLFLS